MCSYIFGGDFLHYKTRTSVSGAVVKRSGCVGSPLESQREARHAQPPTFMARHVTIKGTPQSEPVPTGTDKRPPEKLRHSFLDATLALSHSRIITIPSREKPMASFVSFVFFFSPVIRMEY